MFKVIFGMAEDRKQILSTCQKYCDIIEEHNIKCVVYGQNHRDYKHWMLEISSWIWNISQRRPKKGFKLSSDDYKKNLFWGMGDSLKDSKLSLETFKDFHVKNKEYPDFLITKDICRRLFDCYHELSNVCSSNISKYTSKNDVFEDVEYIFDKYC